MRLSKELIRQVAESVIGSIEGKGMVKLAMPRHEAAEKVAAILTEDLAAEDRLNREVEKMLGSYEGEISKGGMDYRKVFELTKQKLAKDRKIVL